MEVLINEQLLLLNEKLSNASLTDLNTLNEISDELKQLAQVEWKEMERKCSWIRTVPNIVGDNCLQKNVCLFHISSFIAVVNRC